ncbi:MAG: indole-3-glycerol phosphate synthase TrpC [Bryobacteraceae bacterium]
MTSSVPDILARIVEYKRAELAGAMIRREELEKLAAETHRKPRDFRAALLARTPAIIAEIKKASPSKGVLASQADPAVLARAFEQGGAAALSVLTDEKFFHGSLEDLSLARGAVRLPVLRKDFTLDDYHVAEAASGCADAILLIAAILPSKRLRHLREYAAKFGIASIVEVHNEEELAQALDSGAQIIGVNNRDMRTFEVKIETSIRLAEHIPAGILKISESGIRSAEDIRKLRAAGYQAFLVGEHLMRSHQPAEALKALLK